MWLQTRIVTWQLLDASYDAWRCEFLCDRANDRAKCAMSGELIVVAIGGAVLAAAGIKRAFFSPAARLRRALLRIPRRAIAEVRSGERVRIIGRVVPCELVEAPLSGRPCVCYEVVVNEIGKNGAGELLRKVHAARFFVEDESGRALIDPTRAGLSLILVEDHTTHSSLFGGAPDPRQVAVFPGHAKRLENLLLLRQLEYTEGILAPGERVAVVGQGVVEPDPDSSLRPGGYRDAPAMLLRMEGSQSLPLHISDHSDLVWVSPRSPALAQARQRAERGGRAGPDDSR
jgi:hypothetical protein